MTRSKTKAQLTAEQMNEQYQNGLTELAEKHKLGMITQDQYDTEHRALVKKIYGEPEKEN